MRARATVTAAIAIVAARAHADPKPKPVDIKAYRDQLIVLQDASGGTYVLVPGAKGPVFYSSPGHPLHEQYVQGGYRDDDKWTVNVRSPRAPSPHLASIAKREDGSFVQYCSRDSGDAVGLSQITGDRAKQIVAKGSFVTTGVIRVPRVFARDDVGVYYYVDEIDAMYGGKGYRLFVGKKGAMKELGITDLSSDDAGEIFTTKQGVLKIAHKFEERADTKAWWIRNEKKMELDSLDRFDNLSLIYRDLGIYGFTGTICGDS